VSALEFAMAAAKAAIVLALVVGVIPLLIWMERKGAAYIQDRRGPNRAALLGVRLGGFLHVVADAVKLFTKEEVMAARAVRPLAIAAPMIAFGAAAAAAAVVPFTGTVVFGGRPMALAVADPRAGLVLAFALTSLGTYALLLGGMCSSGTYALLGAMRAASQFVSYALAMGLAALSLFLVAGSVTLPQIIADQGADVWRWNIVRQPLAFVIFFTALFAEANRLPFDLPEGDSEIVAGYHVEYSSMRFGLFYVAEYAHLFVGASIVAALFLGGWNLPGPSAELLRAHAADIVSVGWPLLGIAVILAGAALVRHFRRRFGDARDFEPLALGIPMMAVGAALLILYVPLFERWLAVEWLPDAVLAALQLAAMLVKALCLCAAFIWVRWTLPRFRYDQLMVLGWKVLVPLAMANAVVTAAVLMFVKG
jgi:NADH-quinone oxidoreductase subunit H